MSWLNINSLNKTLTAVSNMVAPLDDEDEREAFEGTEEVNDLQEISDAFSSMGSFVSSTLSTLDEILPAAAVGPSEHNASINKGASSYMHHRVQQYDGNNGEEMDHTNTSTLPLPPSVGGVSSFQDISLSPDNSKSYGNLYTSTALSHLNNPVQIFFRSFTFINLYPKSE